MSPRAQYATAVGVMLTGVIVTAAVGGNTGELTGILMVSLGGIALVLALFFNVVPIEDRAKQEAAARLEAEQQRAREHDEQRRRAQSHHDHHPAREHSADPREGRPARPGRGIDPHQRRRPRRPS